MDYFYDGQIRRYVTQFMRVFIGFKYKTGGDTPIEKHVPVMYGDLTRQVAAIIKDNSENKLSTVPKIACYISGLELDQSRIQDPTFVSKVQIRERSYDGFDTAGNPLYNQTQGGGYTVERLMPTPFKLTMKADLWTSNTEQKLQLVEQIMVLFNPSLEIQTTDNYIDWTSLSVINVTNLNFSSRTIPQAAESEIDICTIEFEMPIWISPPAKVKKLGIVRAVVANMFTEAGDIVNIQDIIYNGENPKAKQSQTKNNYNVLLLTANIPGSPDRYTLSILEPNQLLQTLKLTDQDSRTGERLDWNLILDQQGGYLPNLSKIHFMQPSGIEITGRFTVNEIDPTLLSITLDLDTTPSNTIGPLTAIVNPYNFNPKKRFNGIANIPAGTRYLVLDTVNNSEQRGQSSYDGPDAWKNLDGSDPYIQENSIIEWDGEFWITAWVPGTATAGTYFTNLTTGIQYKWDGTQWLKSFEGEYGAGYWRFDLDA
jgi:hypothetical protein